MTRMKKVVVTDSVLIDANETKQIKAKNLKFRGKKEKKW